MADATPFTAFLAGTISFLSPCVLPLVPGYVSLISGSTIDELQGVNTPDASSTESGATSAAPARENRRLLGGVMLRSVSFILGFSLVFIALGATATEIGQLTRSYRHILAVVAGAVIFIFGLHLTGLLQIKALYADKRLHNVGTGAKGSLLGAFFVGFAFAFGWTPCIGPILGAILVLAAAQGTVAKGILLLAIYSLGLAVPFLLTSLGIGRFLAFYARFRRHLHKVEVGSGVLLIALGLLIGFEKFTILNTYLGFLNKWVLGLEKAFT